MVVRGGAWPEGNNELQECRCEQRRTAFSDEICQALSLPNVGTFILVFLLGTE